MTINNDDMKNRNILSQAAVMLLMMLLSATTAWAQEAISGLTYNTAGGYYEIPDAAALNALAAYVNAGNDASWKTFKQTANITFAHTSDWNDTSSTESNFNGIGNDTDNHPFKGSYYGQGFTISGVRMYVYKEGVGLFGYAYNATIDGIVLTDSRITGHDYTGGIVGCTNKNSGKCIVNNCHVRSNVLIHHIENNLHCHGGIVGENKTGCEVTNCTSAVTITGDSQCSRFGGIVGNNTGIMSNNIAIDVNIGSINIGYGAIAGVDDGVLSNNYYYDCTVQGRTSNIGCNGADNTYNNYAVNASPDHFTASGDEYTIKSAAGWNVFCECLNHNDRYNRFSGKTVKLGADIEVSRMAGSDSHDFCGTFDGQKHTLTFNYGKSNAYSNEEYIAPFHFVSTVTTNNVEAPAAIKNLHVAGDIYTSAKYTAGLVAQHWGTLNVENCRNSIVIHSSVSGDGTHGGFEAMNRGKLNITGCLFDGKLLTTNGTKNCGGFVGWHEGGTTNISNSVYAPAALASGETEVLAGVVNNHPSATFGRDAVNSITNCYYARALGTAQGKAPLTVSGGEHVTVSAVSPVGSPTSSDGYNGVYSVSGITAYAKGIKLGGTFYYGSGDNVSLTLTNTPPTGYSVSAYTASSGTLSGTTLTMPDTDATINATWTPIVYSIAYDLDGGTVATANPTTYNVETATFTLTNPTRTGYTFTGWTGSNGSTPQTTMTIAKGSTENKTYTANWTPDPAHFSVSGNEYTIHSATGWGVFCDALQDNDTWNRFSGKTVKLGTDIGTAENPVTRWAGSSGHEFKGTFDGRGHTLTVNYANNTYAETAAPLSYVNGATIRNLIVAGNCGGTYGRAAGIVGESTTTTTITNCVSSVTLNGGPFLGGISIGGLVDIEGCVFNGTINATDRSGGFVGFAMSTTRIANSLFDPQEGSSISGGTFYHMSSNDVTLTNSYYTATLGTAQGKAPRTIEAGERVTVSNIALTGTTTAYTTSGITAYSGGGLSYGGNIYYGSGDKVSLALSHADRTGYTFDGYNASNGGTLNENQNTGNYTLTMPDADATINAKWTPTAYAITYDLDGGTVATDNPTSYNIETATFTLTNPTKPGYTFTGWTGTDIDTPQTTVTIEQGSTEDRTYTAHYEVYTHNFSVGDFTFLNTSATEAKVTACNSSATSVTIPATVTDNEVTYSVTAIDAAAFADCTSLTTVTLQATTPPALGASAFYACSALTTIYVPAGTTGAYTTADNWSEYTGKILSVDGTCGTDVYWSYNSANHTLTIFGTGAMADFEYINDRPWNSYCDEITTIDICEGVTSIGQFAFRNCSGLTSIDIPAGVTSIGKGAFERCTGLTSVTIPASVTTIGDFAFSGCTGLESISVAEGNTKYDSRNNCNAIIETVSNTLILGCKTTVIPNTVTTIGDYAFYGCTGLTSITIPDGVTTIGTAAFEHCTALTSITIPDGVTAIGNAAFMDCSALTSINIPASVTSIGDEAFDYCTSLTTVVMLPTTVPTLGNEAFNNCGSLTTIYVPVGTAGDYKGAPNWKGYAEIIKEYGTCGTDVYWSYNSDSHTLTIFGTGAMADFENKNDRPWNSYSAEITTVDIREGVTSIGWLSFVNCSALTSITIPASVTTIGLNAFIGCYELASVSVVPENTTFDSRNGCNAIIETETNTLILGFKTTVIPDDVMTIGAKAFNSCTGLTSITIPASVTSIGTQAFDGCTGLTTVFMSATTPPTLDVNVFKGCTALTAIYVPAGTADNYKAATNWSDYVSKIKEYGTCGDNVYWSYGSDSHTLTIFGEGSMTDGHPWENYRDDITTVIIREGVTTIGDLAFIFCTGLTSIDIPASVKTIGKDAFYNCSSLTSIDIPAGVTTIGESTFNGCSSLTSVIIPARVTTIGKEAFCGCSGLTSINIPASVTSIGDEALKNCTSLTSVTIPASVTTIGESTFEGCSSLTSVTFAENSQLTSIGQYAFFYCTSLTCITIPASVTSIGYNVFSGCTGLESITVAEGNTKYDSRDNSNALIETASNTLIRGCNTTVIPAGVMTIGAKAFNSCTGLTSITIPASVTSIDQFAFELCTNLKTIIALPTTPPALGMGVFNNRYVGTLSINIYVAADKVDAYKSAWSAYADKIHAMGGTCGEDVYWSYNSDSKKLNIFGSGAMADYTNGNQPWAAHLAEVTKVDIDRDVTTIGQNAFRGCSNLTTLSLQATTLLTLGSDALSGCTALAHVYVPISNESAYKTAAGWSAYASLMRGFNGTCGDDVMWAYDNGTLTVFGTGNMADNQPGWFNSDFDITKITKGVIEEGVTSLSPMAFQGCTGLTRITIPASVTTIGNWAFNRCTDLTSITIPANVTTIGSSVFSRCTGLTTINIPASVTTIGDNAFYDCTGLTSITIPASVTHIGKAAFSSCSSLESISVAEGNTNYDSRNNCNAIIDTNNTLIAGCKNTVIPNTVTSIGNNAFYGCRGLTSITIPDGVTSIGDYAFENCTGLTSITIPASITTIGDFAFDYCTGLTTVVMLPTTVPTLGDFAFESCGSLTTIYVPVGTAETYKEAQGWQYYEGIIKEMTENMPGDANGDGQVNVTDIMAVANYILNIAMDSFDATAADVSGDGVVNVTDIMGIANIILKVNTATSRAVRQEEDEVEPQ